MDKKWLGDINRLIRPARLLLNASGVLVLCLLNFSGNLTSWRIGNEN